MSPARCVCVLSLAFLSATVAFAQDPPNPTGIGLVDMAEIMTKHQPFVDRIKKIQADGAEAEGNFSVKQQDFQNEVAKFQKMQPGSLEAEKTRRKLEKTQLDLKTAIEKELAVFRQRELTANVRINKQIREAVKEVAKAKGLKFVFNHTKLSLDSENPQEQMQAVNQPILFEDGLDVTDDVLAVLAKTPEPKESAPADDKEDKDEKAGKAEAPAPKSEKTEPKKTDSK